MLLGRDEPPAYERIEGRGDRPILFVCDHASNRIPRALDNLGMSDPQLGDHIAWDIGAAGVARRLAERFEASAVIASYSRLVIDLNRNLKDASAFPEISDGVLVPGNLSLGPEARELRRTTLYDPYHSAIDEVLDALTTSGCAGGATSPASSAASAPPASRASSASSASRTSPPSPDASRGRAPVLIAVHSFTPRFHGTERPWSVGVLWDEDPRLSVALLETLRRAGGFIVGDNEPYSGRHRADYSIDHHAERRRLAHVGIEIRQDLIADANGQERWADRLASALERALDDDRVYDPSRYGKAAP